MAVLVDDLKVTLRHDRGWVEAPVRKLQLRQTEEDPGVNTKLTDSSLRCRPCHVEEVHLDGLESESFYGLAAPEMKDRERYG